MAFVVFRRLKILSDDENDDDTQISETRKEFYFYMAALFFLFSPFCISATLIAMYYDNRVRFGRLSVIFFYCFICWLDYLFSMSSLGVALIPIVPFFLLIALLFIYNFFVTIKSIYSYPLELCFSPACCLFAFSKGSNTLPYAFWGHVSYIFVYL